MTGGIMTWSVLSRRLRAALPEREVLVLVVRVPFAPLAKPDARKLACAAERVLRKGDACAFYSKARTFVLAMLAPARETSGPALDARTALSRIAAAFSENDHLELGWWPVRCANDVDAFDTTIERAIDRGARERDRREFLATIGHELRTPLTSIRGYVETVLDEDVDSGTARRFLEIVRSETLRLGRLVEGMLEFSLLDLSSSGRPGVCDLGCAIRAAVDALAPVAAQAGVALHARFEPESFARVGSDACMHALLNILENAVKYGHAGGNVFVYVERDGAGLRVVVDDDGPGIEPNDRERIFEHGARGARAGERNGSGIGLSIVRTLVERAGGRVSASESPLGGARFVVRFARATNDGAELATATS